MEEKEIISLIEQRQAIKEKIEEAELKCKAVDKQIEDALGAGTHHIGIYSVQSIDADYTTFDSTKFKKEHPEFIEKYNKTSKRHTFKITELDNVKNQEQL